MCVFYRSDKMHTEYEVRILEIDVDDIIDKKKENGLGLELMERVLL